MVAVIKVSSSIHRILNYNENKVKQENAVCLTGENFPGDAVQLSFNAKLNYFLKRMELNTNARRNSIHISLNFDPSEKDLPVEKLTAIAAEYMEDIGFGSQPYLVYRHFDAGHPHLHLVSTNILPDGSRIDLHHLGIRKSEPARKRIEEAFGLVKAQDRNTARLHVDRPGTGPAVYGKSETRSAIQNVLEAVLDRYRYTSLHELNAVLGIYNVKAERGRESSRVEKHKGLYYRIINSYGQPVGVPIKASLFYNRPTLARLEGKFARNKIAGKVHTARIKNMIDHLAAAKVKPSLEGLESALAKEGVIMVQRRNSQGFLYGLTYVDHKTGAVFNGSALGKSYSAKEMQERFSPISSGEAKRTEERKLEHIAANIAENDPRAAGLIQEIAGLIGTLTAAGYAPDYVSKHYTRKKKRRKRGTS
ncbi:relaxase/mobilization nuclease domain-containing protein [Flavobacterium sp. MK4S-17]|uniref:relaxase/mobilization nuclease domain-containing protein n=1 Tax=Flavobacterium sp. MK4S-17 TaxID=2543737 RepID=UPI00135BB65E|nr:relaxase/mobilization nuclease domain-containing protein [Flavobacterium sp. MK4S-17]